MKSFEHETNRRSALASAEALKAKGWDLREIEVMFPVAHGQAGEPILVMGPARHINDNARSYAAIRYTDTGYQTGLVKSEWDGHHSHISFTEIGLQVTDKVAAFEGLKQLHHSMR